MRLVCDCMVYSGMVCYSLVCMRYGMIYGMVWCHLMASFGMWYGRPILSCHMVWCGIILCYGIIIYGIWHDISYFCVTVRFVMILGRSMVCCMVWYRYGMVLLFISLFTVIC